MKVLVIGQLPREAGGSYTTGVCNVVYELSKCVHPAVQQFVYATNVKDKRSNHLTGPTQYVGTQIRVINVLKNILKHPVDTIKQWRYYVRITHMSPLRCEFYKDNFLRVINQVNPDIIHCMSVIQMAPLYFANRRHHAPIVLTLHGIFFSNNKKNEDLIKGNIQLADYTTGLTPETISGINGLGFPREKIFIVPNGTDTNKFYYSEDARINIRRSLCINDDTKLLITVGSLQHRKGQLSFCKILHKMPSEFNYKYVIIGKGDDKEKIEQYVLDNGMQEKIQIIGYVPNTELYMYYSAADVYIHGSYEEGQALSEVEAYATDLKIAINKDIKNTIVTDTNNKEDYLIFNYDDFDVKSFVLWCNNKKNNRKSRKQYDWENIYNMYEKVYEQILK